MGVARLRIVCWNSTRHCALRACRAWLLISNAHLDMFQCKLVTRLRRCVSVHMYACQCVWGGREICALCCVCASLVAHACFLRLHLHLQCIDARFLVTPMRSHTYVYRCLFSLSRWCRADSRTRRATAVCRYATVAHFRAALSSAQLYSHLADDSTAAGSMAR